MEGLRTMSQLRFLLLAAAATILLACGPRATVGDAPRAESAAPAPKRLRVGILQEPRGWMPWRSTSTAGGQQHTYWLATRGLTVINGDAKVQPVLAESLPTLANGDWRVNDDGTMDQTWRIRSNARWHDGQPVTAADFVLGWEVLAHPSLPSQPTEASLLAAATALDQRTLKLTFKGTTSLAEQGLFVPFPRHILGEAFDALDPDRFTTLEYWTTAYVGAGPYRLAAWEPGAQMEFAAFREYVEGTPRIDTIVVRFLSDPNTLLANILSGDVDAALPDGLAVEMARDLQQGWAAPGTGNSVVLSPDGRVFRLYLQHRPEFAKPAAARDARVRRALYHTIDKDGVNEVELAGLGRLADSWILPDDPRLPQFRDAIPEWSQDVALAQRILEEAGWQRGTDGTLVSRATGERLETEFRVTQGQGHARAVAVFANGWRQVGALVTETIIPPALTLDGAYRAQQPFAGLYGHPIGLRFEYTHYSCARASSPENRWSGAHGGYCSATADPLIARLQVTIPEAERTALQVQIMRQVLKEDYAELPLYWQVTPYVLAKGVTGPDKYGPSQHANYPLPWNAHVWDKM
jgi:peptide/nickel transport system substrate-binding protein